MPGANNADKVHEIENLNRLYGALKGKGFDVARREVVLGRLPNGQARSTLAYDTLLVAGGLAWWKFGTAPAATVAFSRPERESLRSSTAAGFAAIRLIPTR